MKAANRPRVVILVDNKRRDLLVAGLVADRLDALGIDCELETLEATFASLAAYEPDMLIFNHLSASHLAAYSRRLKDLGVLVGILPNEGIGYKKEGLDFLALKAHNGAHVDVFFCWNEPLAEAVRRNGSGGDEVAEVVGIPRFDFYYRPWSALYENSWPRRSQRPRVLVCTNYVFAKYLEVPAIEAERLFASWAANIPTFEDYWGAIRTHHENRGRLFEFLTPLLESGLYDVVLRPHPGEPSDWYADRIAELPEGLRERIEFVPNRNITELILGCDVEISMDTCTTALESWLAGKPTIDLDLKHHPMLTNEIVHPLNVHCSDPADLPGLVAEALAHPDQPAFAELRRAHLARWCHSPDGTASEQMAKVIAEAIRRRGPRPALAPRLTLKEKRKGLKLKLLRLLNLPYNWNPFLPIRARLDPEKNAIRTAIAAKTILPSDAVEVRRLFRDTFGGGASKGA